MNIPTILHESNAFPGKAVKMLSKRTDVVMVSFEEAKTRLPKAKKIVLTGTPTRILEKRLSLSEKVALKERYKLNPAKPTVLAFGGSQGAKVINDTVIGLAENKINKKYEILLATGQKQYDVVKDELKGKGFDIDKLDGIRIVPYLYELQEVMDACEILVSRAGAITITEITNLGKPSILVPLPNVSHNHQQYNAEVLENIGAAKIIKNDELNAIVLNKTVMEMLDKCNLDLMGENARKIRIENTSDKIYEEIKKLVYEQK